MTAMGFLALMVSVVAIAVNRYLVHSHAALIETNLPAVELASRIGSEAELVGNLVSAFLQTDDPDEMERIATALALTAASMERGVSRLEDAGQAGRADRPRPEAVEIIRDMARLRREILRLTAEIDDRARSRVQDGATLGAVIEAETDLARLRITAGIAGLYTDTPADPRPALDTLADRYFFAFERLTELTRAVDAIRLQAQQLPDIATADTLEATAADLAARLGTVERRIPFLPTASGRDRAATILARLGQMPTPGGLIDLARQRLALRHGVTTQAARLRDAVADLSDQAKAAQGRAQAAGLARIGRAERVTTLISLGLLGVVVLVLLVVGLLWLYARRRFVTRLADLARRIIDVARNEYGAPMPISGRDEIGRMEKAVNVLRRRMQQAAALRDDLEAAVIARTGDVVAEMQAADAARAEAETANRRKTEFLARMTHEIRTPLNGIIGMLHLLEDEVTDDARRERVRVAHRSARDLRDIADDILDFAGTETGAARDKPVHFMTRDLVGHLGQQLTALAAEKGLEARIDMAADVPPVLFGDVLKIRQIAGNLISNAVKYTRRGHVALHVDHATEDETGRPVLGIAVSDTGLGMAPETVAAAFDAYTRAESVERAGIVGMGLGLAISRNLTEALGGSLSVESEPGLGSRFTLTVPLRPGDPDQVADPADDMALARSGGHVLVIDDHAVNRMVARGYLERMGCTVTEAETGQAGIAAVATGAPDLVLLDLDLPDLPGAEVAARIGAAHPRMRIVALTAHRLEDTQEVRARLNVSRILSKPISPRRLAEIVTRAQAGAEPPGAVSDGDEATRRSLQEDVADLGPETARDIVAAFVQDLPGAVAAVRGAQGPARRQAAHRLKGAAANFRLDALCGLLRQIEDAPQDDALLARLDVEAGSARATLEAALRSLGLDQSAAGSTK